MTRETILANARLVLPDRVMHGHVVLRDGMIAEIGEGPGLPPGAEDCGGDYLAPGLVELHTDNLERHIFPRPKVDWPHDAAIIAHDRELAGCGITTVFDAIRVGSIVSDKTREYRKYARPMADEILAMRAKGALRISHHLHLRAEICSETLADELEEFGADDRVGIVSLMDHTPGQRQFRDIAKYEAYMRGKHAMSSADFADYAAFLVELRNARGDGHEAAAVSAAKRFGAVLASHDDSTEAQVEVSRTHGVTVAEFPTTEDAAVACRARDIATIMGAPNLVRGGSHSGNVAAEDLARAGLLDILSSDYVPAALLLGAVRLGLLWDDMARGIATVTRAPARAAGLDDRGEVGVDHRADLIRFGVREGTPELHAVWVQGARAA